jgi:hypothetical protein
MRNLFLLLSILFISTLSFSQEGLKLGLHFTPGISMALNNEDADKGTTLDLQASFAYNTGLLVGYGVSETFSVSTGVGYQQHTTTFTHNRRNISSGTLDPNYGTKITRQANYIRVPLFLEISTDPNRAIGFFARLGPHFDFLTAAVYKDARLDGFSQYDSDAGIDLRQKVTLYQKNEATNGIISLGRQEKIYRNFVPGITAEIGAQVRISDHLKMTLLLHVEGSSNPEGEGAASFAHNLNRGDYLVTANPISSPGQATVDGNKANQEESPFDAVFPNYTDDMDTNATFRSPTWNLMAGFQIGIIYTYSPE